MIGKRLKLARVAAGLSLRDLADRAGGVVSAQAIGKYERNEMMPSSGVLIALAGALEASPDYLLSPDELTLDGIEFRKDITGEREEAAMEARLLSEVERYLAVEEMLGDFGAWSVPDGFPVRVSSMSEAEEAANKLRSAWRLGVEPLPEIAEILEERGIKVVALDLAEKISGVMCKAHRKSRADVPIIVVNASHDGDRQRFTLLHEVGHLVLSLHGDINHEKACHRFASAFLMPAEAIIAKVGRHRHAVTTAELFALKRIFRASAQAIAYRLKDLEIIPSKAFSDLFRVFTANGWRKKEPWPVPKEVPVRFERLVYRALGERCISEVKAAELLATDVDEIRRRTQSLPEGDPAWR